MFNDGEFVSFLLGIMYGIVVLSIMYSWNMVASWEFIKHDNTKGKYGTDIYEVEKLSTLRACLIGLASLFWPLTLAFAILYGVLRLPIFIYRKSAS